MWGSRGPQRPFGNSGFRDAEDLVEGGSSGRGERWLDAEYLVQVEPMVFVHGSDVECGGKTAGGAGVLALWLEVGGCSGCR